MHVLKSKSCGYLTHNIYTLNRKEDLIFIEKKRSNLKNINKSTH